VLCWCAGAAAGAGPGRAGDGGSGLRGSAVGAQGWGGEDGRLVYMGAYGHTFDCHLKRSRFRTSAIFTASLGLDMLTPIFPSHFLLLAAAANIGKSIGLATYLATTVNAAVTRLQHNYTPLLPPSLSVRVT